MIYSYMRVSTNKQEHARQKDLIIKYCKQNNIEVDEWFQDTISGKVFNRPEYNRLKKLLKSNDSVIISSIDRLGRDWDMNKIEYKYFLDNDINLHIVDYPMLNIVVNTNNAMQQDLSEKLIKGIMIDVLCYGAELERKKISERTKQALEVKQKNGTVLGRPKQFNKEHIKDMLELGVSKQDIISKVGCSESYINQMSAELHKGLLEQRNEIDEQIVEKIKNSSYKAQMKVIELSKLGMTNTEIANILNCSRQYVSQTLKKSFQE